MARTVAAKREDMMGEFELMALAALVALAGGMIAAKLTGIVLWKGAAVAAVAALMALIAFLIPGIDRSIALPLAALVGSGVSGALLGLTAPQTAHVLIGAAVPSMLGFVLMEMGAA
jgi:hypothetical protein